MKPQLHEVTGKNRYCGPTAIATVLGISTDHAAAMIRQQSGQVAVKSTSRHHLAQALRSAGCSVYVHVYAEDEQPTMAQWLKLRIASVPHFKANQHVIVNFRNHYGTVLGRRYLCSQTRRQTVSHSEIPGRRGRVTGYLVVSKLPHAAPAEPRPDTSGQASAAAARRKAKALASQHGVTIEREGDLLWVFHKGLHGANDPCSGMHISDDWHEALEKVQAYAVALTKQPEELACPA